MTLINPFVPFTDLEPLQYRREPLGEKAGIFFYSTDDEQVQKFVQCGGVVYPKVQVTNVAECTLTEGNNKTFSLRSSAASSTSTNRASNSNKVNATGSYAPTLSSTLKTILKWIPSLSYLTYKADTAAQLTHSPGNFFFRLGKESPLFKNFTASRFGAQAIAFHPYFPILAVVEQRSPLEPAMIRFYDIGNCSFLDKIVLTHPKMVGVTDLVWKPHSKDVLAVGVFGGVMVWSIPALSAAMEANMASKANGRISLLRGASANSGRGNRTIKMAQSSGNNLLNETSFEAVLPTSPAQAASLSTAIANQPNATTSVTQSLLNHSSLSVKKRPLNELSHILGATKAAKASAAGLGSVNWSLVGAEQVDGGVADANNNSESDFVMHNTTLNPMEASAPLAKLNATTGIAAFIPDAEPPAAFFLTFDFTLGIPVTSIAFSEVSGALMAISSRGSPDTYLHNVGCRPKDSLLTVLTGYSAGISSNISCSMFSMDDSFLMRGYEKCPRLSVTNIASLQTRHFITPAPVLKMVRMESIGFNVFGLMLKGVEAVTIAHISPDAITVLANVVAGEHGETPIGGEVLDIACSSYNLYVRVASGHILVMAVTGSIGETGSSLLLDESEIESRVKNYGKNNLTAYYNNKGKVNQNGLNCQIGVYLKGGICVPQGNHYVVRMDPFQNFTSGALLAVADGKMGTIQFVPSYFTRGIDVDGADS